MTFNKNLLTVTLVAIGGFAAISSANAAGTTDSSFGVTMEVESICTIDAAPVDVVLAAT